MSATNTRRLPEHYSEDNLLGNIISVICDRHDELTEDQVVEAVSAYGGGDFDTAESMLWDSHLGAVCDQIEDEIGLR